MKRHILSIYLLLISSLVFSQNQTAIIGEKWCDVELRNGFLEFWNVELKNGYANMGADISNYLSDLHIKNATLKDVKILIYNDVSSLGKGICLVFENGLLLSVPNHYKNTINKSLAYAPDSSKIFTHKGAIFLAKDGSILATTPTTLLIITSEKTVSKTYKEMFGDVSLLVNPYFKQGKDYNIVDLRDDATMHDKNGNVKIQIDLRGNISIEIVGDE